MSYSAKEVDHYWSSDGSISTLKSITPEDINDAELSHYWGKAKDALRAFERAEDEIVRILDQRSSKGWKS
jgi:hypothetical protein